MLRKKLSGIVLAAVISTSIFAYTAPSFAHEGEHHAKGYVTSYAELVYRNYSDALKDAKALQKAVDAFLVKPDDATLKAAKEAWLVSRNSYGQTEAFRFYQGPIDFVDEEQGREGPEGRLNSWPLNEAYIDYVKGNPKAGIIQDTSIPLTKEAITAKNQAEDEADVSTGYHAIEFLLWGQDLNANGPGNRPVSDYAPTNEINKRRGTYLKIVTDTLVEDLQTLVDAWKPGEPNFAATFTAQDEKKSLGNILSGIATLGGFELASERMAVALDSGDQEDEHSCFSDNTHNDFIYNAKSIKNIYFATYGDFKGESIYELLKAKDAKLAEKIATQINETEKLVAAIPQPIDKEVLSSPKGSKGRTQMEAAIKSLQAESNLLMEAGKVLGIEVEITS